MEQVRIERATAADAAAMLEYLRMIGGETANLSFGAEGLPLSVEAEAEYLAAQETSRDEVTFLAKAGGEIIGDVSLSRKARRMRHRGELGIGVRKAWWGRGVGSALMKEVLDFAGRHGFEQLELEVRSDNARAVRLYERFGFQRLCTLPAFFKMDEGYVDFELMYLRLTDRTEESRRGV